MYVMEKHELCSDDCRFCLLLSSTWGLSIVKGFAGHSYVRYFAAPTLTYKKMPLARVTLYLAL